MSQLAQAQDARQDLLELHLANLGIALALIEHDTFRVRQAIERTGSQELLDPVLADADRIRQAIVAAQDQMSQIWALGQEMGWRP